jgi:hypothetical protein
MKSRPEKEPGPRLRVANAELRWGYMFENWDDDEQRRAQLPWGGPDLPAWLIDWWLMLLPTIAKWEKQFAEELKHYPQLQNFFGFEGTLMNWNLSDLTAGRSGPFCRLYNFCDQFGRLHFADTIAVGELVDGYVLTKTRYRFKDLIKQAGSVVVH